VPLWSTTPNSLSACKPANTALNSATHPCYIPSILFSLTEEETPGTPEAISASDFIAVSNEGISMGGGVEKIETKIPDLSWLFNCSSELQNMVDYNSIVSNPKIANMLNLAFANGFRLALRNIETLNLIELQDIDRGYNQSDQDIYDKHF
jgi:hypothetical protein